MGKIRLTFSNLHEVVYGDTIIYDNNIGVVEYDSKFSGGMKVDGKSVQYVIENYREVYLVSRV